MITPPSVKVTVLASGSNGNAALVKCNGTSILVDAGLSGKKIEERMNEAGATLAEVDGVVISHAHSDHNRGAGVIARRFNLPLYMTEKTFRNSLKKCNLAHVSVRRFTRGKTFEIGGVTVQSVVTSHDVESSGFVIGRFGIFTDTGRITEQMEKELNGLAAILLESNHDVEMLKNGPYPPVLKQRILSHAGHLSNVDAAEFLHSRGRHVDLVLLGHLSGENNTPVLASSTFEEVCGGMEYRVCSREGVTGTFTV